jgi:hypothetical protein
MAAGLGFKTFTTGEVLTAADTNGYLMQGVLVFASSAARAAAITSPQEGQYSYLKDTNSTEYYDGAAWIAAPIGDITGVTAGTGISGGGTSGTVTITNSMATEIAAKGDLIVGTGAATFDNLTVGANGTTLVADSTASTGLKWATPASGSGFTLIQRSTFSAVANTGTTFDGVFTSTYISYQIVFETFSSATVADDLHFQLRYAGPTTQTGYQTQLSQNELGSTSWTVVGGGAATEMVLCTDSAANNPYSGTLNTIVQSTSFNPPMYGFGIETYNGQMCLQQGIPTAGRIYTGFILKSAAANITGTVAIYGLAK